MAVILPNSIPATEFCNPARGNEKGGVEGEVGYFRRNHLVPVPQAKNLEELNQYLRKCCQQGEQRRIAGKPMLVGEATRIERERMLPLTAEGFELAEISFPTVDSKGCVKVRTNFYSTPLRPGTRPQAKLLPAYVEIWQERECVARHERSFGRYEQVLDLEHYLDCWRKNRERWRDRVRCGSGANADAGRRVSTGSGRACRNATTNTRARGR